MIPWLDGFRVRRADEGYGGVVGSWDVELFVVPAEELHASWAGQAMRKQERCVGAVPFGCTGRAVQRARPPAASPTGSASAESAHPALTRPWQPAYVVLDRCSHPNQQEEEIS